MSLLPFIQSLLTPFTKHEPLRITPSSSVGMRSGHVRLKSNQAVSWHTTGNSEESIVVMRGRGEMLTRNEPPQPFEAPCFIFIPANTEHSVRSTDPSLALEYVYVVATVAK